MAQIVMQTKVTQTTGSLTTGQPYPGTESLAFKQGKQGNATLKDSKILNLNNEMYY